MTDHSDLIERLRSSPSLFSLREDGYQISLRNANRLVGDCREAASRIGALSSQSLSLSEAREEIERLREALRLVVAIREGTERGNSLKVAQNALVSGSREDGADG